MTQPTSDQRRPFLSAPSPDRYFAAAATEEARQRIVRTIARSEGPAILVGAAGTGKSLLLAVLAEQFARRMSVVTLAGAQLCTRKALLQMILCELGLPYRGLDEGELRLAILQHLRGDETSPANTKQSPAAGRTSSPVSRHRPDAATPRPMLLLVDEADALPIRLMQELRVLTNISASGLPLVRLVLAGGPMLEERFADPQLELFSQRIAARCYLAPLGREESLQYVRAQVAAVGTKPERLFTTDALEAIHSATGGVPRLINQLGDQLVWMAEETGCAPLDAALVQQAWSDLQQLPAPWNIQETNAAGPNSGAADMIEFGELDSDRSPYTSAAFMDEPLGFAELDESEDEHPASIPIAAARPNRAIEALVEDDIEASLEAAERLMDSFKEFEELEIRAADPEPAPAEEPGPPAAENPFAEPFDEEEIVLDPYAAFESELLRTAPQVINRLDRAFAGELHRCVQRAAGQTPAARRSSALVEIDDEEQGVATALKSKVRLHDAPASSAKPEPPREILIIEDDDQPGAAIIPGRQFRRLFSALEAAGSSRASY